MKGKFDKSYKGSAGSITDVFYYKDQNVVVSTSLDRYLRIHDAETKEIVGHVRIKFIHYVYSFSFT